MKKILFIIIALLSMGFVHAQTKNKLWGALEVGVGYSFVGKADKYNRTETTNNSLSLIQIVLGYYIIPDLSLGAGIGINGYSNPGLNTIPLFIDIRYHPLKNKKWLLNGNIGYPLTTNEDYIKAKSSTSLSIGYTLLKIKNIKIVPSIGYNYCSYTVTGINNLKYNDNRSSVFAKISVVY